MAMDSNLNNIQILTNNNDEEDTIDLLEIASYLLSKAWIIILGVIVGAVLAGVGTKFLITPMYEADSMIYVYSKSTSITSLADLQVGSQLAVDFQIVAGTQEVMDTVISKLGLDLTYEQLSKRTTISNPSGSHILKIVVTDPDPVQAARLSNAIAEELRARIAEVMNTDKPSTVHRAYVPKKPSSPSLMKNTALGGIGIGAVIAAIFVVVFLMDDTIKTAEDVRKYLGMNVLAEVPINNTSKKKVS